MITSKQRAYLKKLAHALDPIFQIGKDGINDALLKGLDEALEKREILKVHILESALLDTKPTCNEVAAELRAEPVIAIGNKFVLYRQSSDVKKRKIELPKAAKK